MFLFEAKDGCNVLLTLDSEVGRAVFKPCNSNTHDDGIIITKAAHILQKQLFLNKQVFDGDLLVNARAIPYHYFWYKWSRWY